MRKLILTFLLIPLVVTAEISWRLQGQITTTTSINDIQFVTPAVGWVRAGNLLYTTNNGGNSWKLIPLVLDTFKTISNFEIRFFTKSSGWLLLERGMYLFKSVDGGDSWRRSTIPDMYVKDICFSDSLKGWACGINYVNNYTHEIVIHTVDGGITWKTSFTGNDGSSFDRILFVDSLTGWIAGDHSYCPFSEFCRTIGFVNQTTDGGVSWKRVFTGEIPSAMLSSIQATDNRHVFIFGCDVFEVDYRYSEPTLVSTDNQGRTWKSHIVFPRTTTTTNDSYKCSGIYFADSRNGYLIASRHDSSDLMKTIDGGITWQSQKKFAGTFTAFEMLDTTHAWIGTEKGLLYVLSTPLAVRKNSSFYSRQSDHTTIPQTSLHGYLLNGRQIPIGSISAALWQQRFIHSDNHKSSPHITIN
jgi:photosystem II stability/assembly factor-like uncharacterized protein